MGELTIGSGFWYKDKLCEVVEFESAFKCIACKICGDRRMCEKTNCFADSRHDGKSVCFAEVKE